MKSLMITICGAVIFLSSCSMYRSGQTPDDVYYSPVREEGVVGASNRDRERDEYVQGQSARDAGRRYQQDQPSYSGYDDYATMDDRWLMMRVRNPYRWSYFDDYSMMGGFSPFASPWSYNNWNMGYGYSGLGFGFNYGFYNPYSFGFNNYFNSYWNWNSYYNPYYPYHPGVIVGGGGKTNPDGYTKARNFNMNNYRNTNYNNNRSVSPGSRPQYGLGPSYNNTNSSSGRRVFSNNSRSDNNYSAPSRNNNSSRPVRTYNPSYNNNSRPSYDNSPSYSPSGRSSGSSGGGYNGGGSGGGSGSRPSRR